jgi:hypothetical protein
VPRELPSGFGKLLLQRPAITGLVTLAAIGVVTAAFAGLDAGESLGAWVGWVAAGLLVYVAIVAWFMPRIVHRGPRDVVEISLAAAVSAVLVGGAASITGSSAAFLYVGAVESALLVVVVLMRAVGHDRRHGESATSTT